MNKLQSQSLFPNSSQTPMETGSKGKRSQFSSCDACRRARVACDASDVGYQPGETLWAGSCSRCYMKKQKCTFEWIKDAKGVPRQLPRNLKSERPLITSDSFIRWEQPGGSGKLASRKHFVRAATDTGFGGASGPCEPIYDLSISHPDAEASEIPSSVSEWADVLLTRWSDQILQHGFGTIFGGYVGRDGCPLVNDPDSHTIILPTKLFHDLDVFADRVLSNEALELEKPSRHMPKREEQINESLRTAVRSYTVRWIPVIVSKHFFEWSQLEETIRAQWRIARKDMLRVINRASYRSVLALYLFGQTPVPMGISEEEEADGLSGMVCIQTALKLLQQLRGRLRTCQFDGSETTSGRDRPGFAGLYPDEAPLYLDLENRAYWAAVNWDTADALTLNIRSSLTTGLKGACLEPAWVLSRSFISDSFCMKSEKWRREGFKVSDEVACQVISAANISRLYIWRTIASLKEALIEGEKEDSVLFAWKALLDALDVFRISIRPLLNICEKDLDLLSQHNRLNWYEAEIHYYLGILVLVEAVEAARRLDLLSHLTEAKLDAERGTINVLEYGLESIYTIHGPDEKLIWAPMFPEYTSEPQTTAVTTNFIAIDPYPHYVLASARLVSSAINRQHLKGDISPEEYNHFMGVLFKTLKQLPQSSKSVFRACENLQNSH